MELPPGRVERIADGGADAIRAILADLRSMKFNGLLKTSVFRGDTPSQGVLVFRGGDGVLAEHRGATDVLGSAAVSEILRDAASDRAQIEVRTYDYGHSTISIDQLEKSYPAAAVEGLADVVPLRRVDASLALGLTRPTSTSSPGSTDTCRSAREVGRCEWPAWR